MTRRPLLLVSESAQATMIAAATRTYPCETGGILVGVHVSGQPWATAVIEIANTDRGPHHYKIPGGATQPAVCKARKLDPRLGYLGDWHSHPVDVGPSPIDFVSLGLVSIKHPAKPNPTLVVVRRTKGGYVLDARRIVAAAPRRCELRLAGDLPPPVPLSQ